MLAYNQECRMTHEDCKTVLYRQDDGSWVAEIPAIPGCHALMPSRGEALAELASVFGLLAEEFRKRGQSWPADSTEIINA
jgi:predicted RNase H-like HicB family nuclease